MANTNKIDLARDFLQSIVDHLPIALFCKNARHGFEYVFWNATAARMWGFSTVEVVGKTDFDLWPHEMASFFRKKDMEAMSAKETVYIPHEPILADGKTMYLRTWKVPIFGDDGGPQWLLGIAQDITAQTQLEGKMHIELAGLTAPAATEAVRAALQALEALQEGEIALATSLLEYVKKLAK